MIRTAREVNDSKPEWVLKKVKLALADHLQSNPDKTMKDVTITCLGLAFKPDIDDLRESPAMAITKQIVAMHSGPTLVAEPNILKLPEELSGRIQLDSTENSIRDADIVLLLVDHKEFKEIPINQLTDKILIDTRGITNQKN